MDKSKFLMIVVVSLLVLNLGTLSFLFIQTRHPKGPHGGNHQKPDEFLISELSFDEQQSKQFQELKKEHQTQMKALQDSIRNQRELLPDAIIAGNDSLAADLSDKIGNYQARIELFTYQHFKKVRSLCDEDQAKDFGRVIDDMLKMMAPPPPGNRGPMGPPPR